MRIRTLWVLLTSIALGVLCWGAFAWRDYNPLKKYGVSFEKTHGEHASFQTIRFSLDRNQKHIIGPAIVGDDLYVSFKTVTGEAAPRIVVRSKDYKARYIVLKLNFTNEKKPEFEIVENHMMGISYPALGLYCP